MKIIFSHPTGNANVRAAASAFMEANLLSEFQTAIASFPGDIIDAFGSVSLFREIRRRTFDPSLKPVTRMWPWLEVGRLISSKTKISKLTRHETGPFCIDAIYRDLDRRVASRLNFGSREGIRAVYAYEDGAKCSFTKAKQLGLESLYDLPIGYWRAGRRLLEIEKKRWPEWASTITGFDDSETKLRNKDQELALADRIFVASKFTAKTLEEFPGTLAPVEVIPYGFPKVGDPRSYSQVVQKSIKLLFVGSLSQRKGIADLFSAVEAFGDHIKLTIVGQKVKDKCEALDIALAKHTWIPSLAHEKVLQLMREQDVLIFPSLFEGFGLVITEAMSQGTPVITTDRTAGPDIIKHDHNGWIAEAGSVKGLQSIVEKLLCNPQLIAKAGREASETARQRPWKLYAQELVQSVQKHLEAQSQNFTLV